MRKLKEKYEVTEMRKQYNRITFGTEEQKSFRDTGKTLGQLGLSTGKVRLAAQDKGVLKKQKTSGKSFGTSGATSGLSSSLAFTPVQGLELSNPQASIKETKEKYFGNSTFFKATQEMKEAEKK
jgi:U4/U6 small nuclear ribonucleoprotein PRP31